MSNGVIRRDHGEGRPDLRIPAAPMICSPSVAQILHNLADSGSVQISALVIREAAGLLDETERLLGRLAECFEDDEIEFADIAALRAKLHPNQGG